jgi:hypothetical protein
MVFFGFPLEFTLVKLGGGNDDILLSTESPEKPNF